jgi:hypothetical protein
MSDKPKQFWVIDFDNGGSATKSAFYANNDNIKCWEPWVMNKNDRTAYDYPATHDRTVKIMQFALDSHEDLWGVLVTGIDLWDSVATNCMRIQDLGLSKDGIEAADNRGQGENKRVQSQWDWSIRTTRFHQLTALSRALVKRGVNVFWETHLKDVYNKQGEITAKEGQPAWEKTTAGYMYQIIHCRRKDSYDDDGEVTRSEFTATFEKSKTDATLQGQRSTILITEQGKQPSWLGLPELQRL